MTEAKPQDGSTVKGYRKLDDTDIAMMNEIKDVSRGFLKKLEFIRYCHPNDPVIGRWLAIAKTDMQTACMAACRAIARPDEDC